MELIKRLTDLKDFYQPECEIWLAKEHHNFILVQIDLSNKSYWILFNSDWANRGYGGDKYKEIETLREEALAKMPKRVQFKGFIDTGVNSYHSDGNEEIIQDFKSCIFKIFEENTKVKVIIEEVQE